MERQPTKTLQAIVWGAIDDAIDALERDYMHELTPGMQSWPQAPWQPETLTAWYESTCTAFDDVYGLIDHLVSPDHAALRHLHEALDALQEIRRRIELARMMHTAKAEKRVLAMVKRVLAKV